MDYIYICNLKVKNGHYPTSRKDTEEIFIGILKTYTNHTVADVKSQELE